MRKSQNLARALHDIPPRLINYDESFLIQASGFRCELFNEVRVFLIGDVRPPELAAGVLEGMVQACADDDGELGDAGPALGEWANLFNKLPEAVEHVRGVVLILVLVVVQLDVDLVNGDDVAG
jgi:hypothetical protein